VNSIPQRSPTKYLLRELQAWARQIVRIESVLVFPELFHLEIYQSIRGRGCGMDKFQCLARQEIFSNVPRPAALPPPSLEPIEYQELVPLW